MNQPSRGWVVVLAVVGVVLGWSQPVQAGVPNDLQSTQSYLQDMTKTYGPSGLNADEKNTGSYGAGKQVIIAIIGSGLVDFTHPDLDGKKLAGSASGTGEIETAMALIAAAETDNNFGIAGVCRNCKILSIQADLTDPASIWSALNQAATAIYTAHGSPTTTDKAQGVILLATDRDLGYDGTLKNALQAIYQPTGPLVSTAITVIVPAGNGEPVDSSDPSGARYPTSEKTYPCAYTADPSVVDSDKLVFCVGAADTTAGTKGRRSVFSNYGEWVDAYAPGQGILADTNRALLHDTRAAAAIAAGVAARIHAITYAKGASFNTPANIQFMLWNLPGAVYPGVLNDLAAANIAQSQSSPFLSTSLDGLTRRVRLAGVQLTPLFERVFDFLFGVQEAWAGQPCFVNGVVADLRSPGENFLVIPDSGDPKQRDQFFIRGRAVRPALGTTYYKVELWKHLSCVGGSCTSYSAGGVYVKNLVEQTLISGQPYQRPTSQLGYVGPGETSSWAEGEYTLKLKVWNGTTNCESKSKVYVEKSYESTFNENAVGVGAPELKGDVVVHGPNLADLTGDGKPEVVVASTQQRRVYAFDGIGNVQFKSAQMAGRVLGTPAVGDVDGDGFNEIVVTADVTGQPSLYVWDADTREQNPNPKFTAQIGPSKSSPALGKAQPSDSYLSIFVTTTNNQLHWYKWDGNTFVPQGDPAVLTCDTCSVKPLMESSPVVANVQDLADRAPNSYPPIRVFVPSQAAFKTYGFDPQPPSTSPRLMPLPGFPIDGIGGIFDSSAGYFTNRGRLEMFDVRYLWDANPANDRSRLVLLQVRGATSAEGPSVVTEYELPATELLMYSGAATGPILGTGNNFGAQETAVVGQSGKVYLFDSKGQLLCSAQMGGRGAGTPLIVDLDGNGERDILAVSNDQLLYGFTYVSGNPTCQPKRTVGTGTNIKYGFPRALKSSPCFQPMPYEPPVRNWARENILHCTTPVAKDIDNDTKCELTVVAASGDSATNAIYMWEFPQAGQGCLSPWGVAHGNPRNAGQAQHASISGVVRNSSGGLLPNASMAVQVLWQLGDGTRMALDAFPDSNGHYKFDQINPGMTYEIYTNGPSGYQDTRQYVTPTYENPDVVVNITKLGSGGGGGTCW